MSYPQVGISTIVGEGTNLGEIIAALKIGVAALRRAEVPFLLAGSLAAWARGGPQPQKDLDLMLKPTDAERALEALEEAGMRAARPPEEWLYKAWCGEVMIDLIFCPAGLRIDDQVFARADTFAVMAINTPVMAIEDVLVTKLYSLDEHSLDFSPLLAMTRALREQIDWQQLQARTCESAYAKAFFTLVRELGIAPTLPSTPGARRRVRVVPDG
jgi:Uncharacterised nucleotidyltransferase